MREVADDDEPRCPAVGFDLDMTLIDTADGITHLQRALAE